MESYRRGNPAAPMGAFYVTKEGASFLGQRVIATVEYATGRVQFI
jgi:hypothetical protein